MILVLPAATAVTVPLAATVAVAVVLLDQAPVPPPNTTPLAVYAALAPIHSGDVPVTDVTTALGVTVSACSEDLVPPHPPVMV